MASDRSLSVSINPLQSVRKDRINREFIKTLPQYVQICDKITAVDGGDIPRKERFQVIVSYQFVK